MTVSDDVSATRQELRDNPHLNYPENVEHLFASLRLQAAAKRTNLAVRVPVSAAGVALADAALPNLPGSMVQILGGSRRTGAQTMGGALVSRQGSDWVVAGSESVKFVVTKNKKVVAQD